MIYRDLYTAFTSTPDGRHFSDTYLMENPMSEKSDYLVYDDPIAKLIGPKAKKTYNTVAVRYLRGPNPQKAYTYRVRKGAKLHLGQEVVVPTNVDGYVANTIAVVVELHKTPQDTGPYNYLFAAGTVKPL